MNTKMKNCPICKEQYYSISRAEDVCGKHEDWFITECKECGRMCFSDEVGLCVRCFKKSFSNHNHVEDFE